MRRATFAPLLLLGMILMQSSAPAAPPTIRKVVGTFTPGTELVVEGIFPRPGGGIVYSDFNGGMKASLRFPMKAFGTVQNLSYSATGGRAGGGAVGKDGVGTWTIPIPLEIKPGETYLFCKDIHRNFTVSAEIENYKIWRAWWRQVGGGFNAYFSPSNGRLYSEYAIDPNGFWVNRASVTLTSRDWVTERILVRGSNENRNDGFFAVYYGSRQVAGGPIMTSFKGRNLDVVYIVHEVIATGNGRWPNWKASNTVRVDNLYAQKGFGHVLAADHPQMAKSSRLAILPILSASNGSVRVLVPNAGTFRRDETVYLHLVNDSLEVTQSGFPMKVR